MIKKLAFGYHYELYHKKHVFLEFKCIALNLKIHSSFFFLIWKDNVLKSYSNLALYSIDFVMFDRTKS